MTRPERLKTSLTSLGTKLSVSVCRSASVAPLTPTYHLWSPAGDKPWYLHRGKTAAALHLKPFTWGNQRRARSHQASFLAPLPGTPSAKIGELHTTLYLYFFSLVSLSFSFYLCVFYQKLQKNLPPLLLLWGPLKTPSCVTSLVTTPRPLSAPPLPPLPLQLPLMKLNLLC